MQFNSMVQINEDTGNRRPIMLSSPPKEKPSAASQTGEQVNKTDSEKEEQKEGESRMDVSSPASQGQTSDSNAEAKKPTEQQQTGEKSEVKEGKVKEEDVVAEPAPRVLTGLAPEQVSTLVRCGVYLIGLPVEPDTLHALLRLLLRLTRDHEHAVTFAEQGGVRLLLGLKQTSDFQGFASLVTLLVRHVLEDPSNMRHTLFKVGLVSNWGLCSFPCR